MSLSELQQYHRNRGLKVLAKLGKSHFSNMGKASVQSRFKGMSKEEISEYFRKVKAGTKINLKQ